MRVTISDLKEMKANGEKIPMITAYDYTSARIVDTAGLPVILVGDTLGQVVLGYDSTLPVTMDEMLHHSRAVAQGRRSIAHHRRHAVHDLSDRSRGRHAQRRPLPSGGRRARG